MVLAALLGSVALIATLVLAAGTRDRKPFIDAPGDHFKVSAAATANGPIEVAKGVLMGADQKHDTSRAVRDYPTTPVRALPVGEDEGHGDSAPDRAWPTGPDTVVQSTIATPAMPSTTKNFEGIDYPGVACNCAPPDTNGEAGLTQFVQTVNNGYQVWNKSTGASVFGPVAISTIWSGFGGVCQSNGDGDPVLLYDQFANRWLVSQFAGSGTPTDECIAISTTSDATGSYYRYDFHLGANFFDYPHLAVWPDGYYMSMNIYNSAATAFLGPEAFVFDRAKMLSGAAATFQTPSAALDPLADAFLPADVDGSTPPPAGAAATFVSFPSTGTYKTQHYHVDWTTPGNSTFTTFASPPAAGFSLLCPTTRNCVPQSGSSNNLDGIGDRPMFRLAYRNFGDHESVVGNFSVLSGGVAGIRWFELRGVTSGPETVYQESTYQPDTTWRWMGSAAMDQNGDLAVGFSASSSAIFPQIRYAGRLAGDPLNTLAQGEATLLGGAGSQFGTSNRWGDYSDLTIDPGDDCTFWYTTEYYQAGNILTNQFNWKTRIGSFSFAGCGGSPTTGGISGHVTDSVSHAAISGATVSVSGGPSTSTDGTGAYSFSGLNPAAYSVTASATGHSAATNTNVTVTAGSTTTSDFALSPTTGSISGTVVDASSSLAISGATVAVSGGPSTTTNASGGYTLSGLAGGASYSVTASKTGYLSQNAPSVPVTAGGTTTQNFSLTANPVHTTAFVFPSAAPTAGTGGHGDGYQTAPANWWTAFDGNVATDSSSGTASSQSCTATTRDSEVAGSFSMGSLGSSILGIQVQLRGKANTSGSSPKFCVQVSNNGGSTWSTGKVTATLKTSLTTYTLGTTSDLWGLSWSSSTFGGNFRVRIVDLANATNKTFTLDGVSVAVTYQ